MNGNPGISYVPENVQDFHDYYFNVERTLRRKADCKINETINVQLNEDFHPAKVRKFYGSSIILIEFVNFNRFEWIYEGSARIQKVYDSINNYLKRSKSESHHQTKKKKVRGI